MTVSSGKTTLSISYVCYGMCFTSRGWELKRKRQQEGIVEIKREREKRNNIESVDGRRRRAPSPPKKIHTFADWPIISLSPELRAFRREAVLRVLEREGEESYI